VDIESVLSLHPAVDEVAVAGLPDERWGQKVVAFVKAKGPVDAKGLDDYCAAPSCPTTSGRGNMSSCRPCPNPGGQDTAAQANIRRIRQSLKQADRPYAERIGGIA